MAGLHVTVECAAHDGRRTWATDRLRKRQVIPAAAETPPPARRRSAKSQARVTPLDRGMLGLLARTEPL